MKSTEHLYRSFIKKRESFLVGINDKTNSAIKEKALHAALSCDLCAETFIELSKYVPLIQKHYNQRLEDQQKKNSRYRESIREAYEFPLKIELSDLREASLLLADACAESSINSMERDYGSMILENESISHSMNFALETFEEVFKADNNRFILAASLKLFSMILGFIPGGVILSAINDINDIIDARENEVKQADAYLSRFDTFIKSVSIWCTGIQMLIAMVQNLDDLESAKNKLTYSAAAIEIQKRFSDIINRAVSN